jgi:hypothetical protein
MNSSCVGIPQATFRLSDKDSHSLTAIILAAIVENFLAV